MRNLVMRWSAFDKLQFVLASCVCRVLEVLRAGRGTEEADSRFRLRRVAAATNAGRRMTRLVDGESLVFSPLLPSPRKWVSRAMAHNAAVVMVS